MRWGQQYTPRPQFLVEVYICLAGVHFEDLYLSHSHVSRIWRFLDSPKVMWIPSNKFGTPPIPLINQGVIHHRVPDFQPGNDHVFPRLVSLANQLDKKALLCSNGSCTSVPPTSHRNGKPMTTEPSLNILAQPSLYTVPF